jgi:DNA-directed RNA polymerase specialized sigma subunit
MFDKEANARRYDAEFTLDTAEGIERLLNNFTKMENNALQGDYTAVDIMVDLAHAIKIADLTEKQWDVLNYYCVQGYTQKETAQLVGVSQQRVGTIVATATLKIAEVFAFWALHDEGYTYTGEDLL